jgi:hypothetical protein
MADLAPQTITSGSLIGRYALSADLMGLQGTELSLTTNVSATLTAQLVPILRGEPGPPGSSFSLSADNGNTLRVGSDGGIFSDGPTLASAQW